MANPAIDNRGAVQTAIDNNLASGSDITASELRTAFEQAKVSSLYPEDLAETRTLSGGNVVLDRLGAGAVYGDPTSPETGNLTINTGTAILGAKAVIVHNDSTEPTIAGAVKEAGFNYSTGSINLIVIEKLGANYIVATTKRQVPPGGGLTSVQGDTNPVLGGDLDMDEFQIEGVSAEEMGHLSGASANLQLQLAERPQYSNFASTPSIAAKINGSDVEFSSRQSVVTHSDTGILKLNLEDSGVVVFLEDGICELPPIGNNSDSGLKFTVVGAKSGANVSVLRDSGVGGTDLFDTSILGGSSSVSPTNSLVELPYGMSLTFILPVSGNTWKVVAKHDLALRQQRFNGTDLGGASIINYEADRYPNQTFKSNGQTLTLNITGAIDGDVLYMNLKGTSTIGTFPANTVHLGGVPDMSAGSDHFFIIVCYEDIDTETLSYKIKHYDETTILGGTAGATSIPGATTILFDKDYIQDSISQSGNINIMADFTGAVLGKTVRMEIVGNSTNFITHSLDTSIEKGSFDNTKTNVAYITYVGNDKVDMVIEAFGGGIGVGTDPLTLASFDFGWDATQINTSDAAQARQDGADHYLVQLNDQGAGGINLTPSANANQPLIGTRGGQQFLIFDGVDDHLNMTGISKPGSTFETVIAFVDFVHSPPTVQVWINQTEAGGGKLAITTTSGVQTIGKDNLGAFPTAIDSSVAEGLHMIACVSDSDLNQKLYIDGVLVHTSPSSADSSWVSSSDGTWQQIWASGTPSHLGALLHFNNALNATTIADIWTFYQNRYGL